MQLRYTLYKVLYSSDTHSIGPHTGPLHTALEPAQIRYELHEVLYSSDTECIGSYTPPTPTP